MAFGVVGRARGSSFTSATAKLPTVMREWFVAPGSSAHAVAIQCWTEMLSPLKSTVRPASCPSALAAVAVSSFLGGLPCAGCR
eukprot:scaffold5824_cov73-Phaeocystis_antarctica.AAC.5